MVGHQAVYQRWVRGVIVPLAGSSPARRAGVASSTARVIPVSPARFKGDSQIETGVRKG